MLSFAGASLAIAAAGGAASVDPLASIRSGLVQCHAPDERRRTCRSIASYKPIGANTFTNTATVLISAAGPVVLETSTPVEIKDGTVCGRIRAEDLRAGKLRVAGRLASSDEAAPVLALVLRSMTAMLNKEICTSYEQSATGLTATAKIDGVYRRDADQPVKWVRPDEGYTVAP